MRSPFKFLDSYGVRDKEVFFGREKEVAALYTMVYKTPLSLLYGLSGTGKTSIVQCGLANRFEGPDWLPFYIRREQDINETLCRVLQEALESNESTEPAALVSALFDDYLRPVYLIFDQFEELFILGSTEEQATFARSLQQLLARKLPCRVILVVREEYLGQMYLLEKEIPTLFDHRLRIEPMNNARVNEVLEKSFDKFNITLEEPAAALRKLIIEKLSAGKSGIQLPYLQVYLDILYREDYQHEYGDRERGDELPPLQFTRDEIEEFGSIDTVLDKFLREQTTLLQAKLQQQHPGISEQAVRTVLDAFVTEDGTKRPLRLRPGQGAPLPVGGQLKLFDGIPPAALSDCLTALEESRLLRIADDSAELAHDSLAQLIDQQRTDEQRQLNEVRRRISASYIEKEKTGVWPTERQLLSMEALLPKVALDETLRAFVEQSYAEVTRQKEEEERVRLQKLAEAEAQAVHERILREQAEEAKTEAERQRTLAEQNEKRAGKRTRLAVLISLLAVLLAGVAGLFFVQANVAKTEAEAAKLQAEQNFDRAESNFRKAEEEEKIAKDALVQVEREKEATEEQRRKAEENYARAQEASRLAKAEEEKARLALVELGRANVEVAQLLLSDIERDMLATRYDDAYRKIKPLVGLGVLKEELTGLALELCFWYGETGRQTYRDSMLQTAYFLSDKKPEARDDHREAIAAMRPGLLDILMRRYYLQDLIKLEGGTFEMGCKPERDGDCDKFVNEKFAEYLVLHEQKVSSFYIARQETSWWQYRLYCEATNRTHEPPGWGIEGDNPVVNVSWYDAIEYANWLSLRAGLDTVYTIDKQTQDRDNRNERDNLKWSISMRPTANGYRLPSEAEWEYAARAGRQERWAGCSVEAEIGDYAWYGDIAVDANFTNYKTGTPGNSGARTQAVRRKKPNAYGLYDMSGNVFEWCWDWYDIYPKQAITDYTGPKAGSIRVVRGGGWSGVPQRCRVAGRNYYGPSIRGSLVGFRLARTP